MFDQNALYTDIVKVWGENGAHAETFRDICEKAKLTIAPVAAAESMDDLIRRIYREENGSKIQTIKRLRFEQETYLSLSSAKALVEKVVG
jgi:ribosomal protein L7/L12